MIQKRLESGLIRDGMTVSYFIRIVKRRMNGQAFEFLAFSPRLG